jgi:hypothetical protein
MLSIFDIFFSIKNLNLFIKKMLDESKKLSHFRGSLRSQIDENAQLKQKISEANCRKINLEIEVNYQRGKILQLTETIEGLTRQLKLIQDERESEKEKEMESAQLNAQLNAQLTHEQNSQALQTMVNLLIQVRSTSEPMCQETAETSSQTAETSSQTAETSSQTAETSILELDDSMVAVELIPPTKGWLGNWW